MKETLLDVLMYLFENYHDGEFSDSDNQETLRVELAAAGFPEEEVGHAFAWLDGLANQRNAPALAGRTDALRIYAPQEQERLSAECRGFLLYLEQLGILNAEGKPAIHAHRFRHTLGTQLAEKGARTQTIMKILGHLSAGMSMTYSQIYDPTVLADYQVHSAFDIRNCTTMSKITRPAKQAPTRQSYQKNRGGVTRWAGGGNNGKH